MGTRMSAPTPAAVCMSSTYRLTGTIVAGRASAGRRTDSANCVTR